MSSQREESKLKRNIGIGPLMGIAYGQIIGAGIMTLTGTAIGITGTGVVIVYVISALCTLFNNYPTAILGAALPATGGNYRYISRLHGKELGFIFIVVYFVQNLTIALYTLSCASYLGAVITGVPQRVIAVCVLLLAFGINLIGNKQSALVTTGITLLLLIGCAMFIFFGFQRVDFGYVFNPSGWFPRGVGGFVESLAVLSFATGGAQVISNMGSEIIDPGKNIPRVMIISTLSVGVLYALIAVVATGVLPLETVSGQNLALVAKEVMPAWAFNFFVLAAGAGATAKTLNVTLSHVSKPVLVAAEDGLFPKALAKVDKRGVPSIILFMFFFIGLVPLLLGIDINLISRMGTAIGLLSKIMYSYAFLNLPKKYPQQLANSTLKVSDGMIKVFGWGSIVLQAAFSYSLIINLPTIAIIGFSILVACAIAFVAVGGLKKITIPDDLAIDYIAQAQEAEAEA